MAMGPNANGTTHYKSSLDPPLNRPPREAPPASPAIKIFFLFVTFFLEIFLTALVSYVMFVTVVLLYTYVTSVCFRSNSEQLPSHPRSPIDHR